MLNLNEVQLSFGNRIITQIFRRSLVCEINPILKHLNSIHLAKVSVTGWVL